MEWKPIESAPKDGTEVILLLGETIPQASYIRCGTFIDYKEARDLGFWQGWLVWSQSGADFYVYGEDCASHWMPLPPPPKDTL